MKAAALLLLVLAAPADPRALWIRAAHDVHAKADLAIASGNEVDARNQLVAFLSVPPPASVDETNARAVQQDIWFRVAELDLHVGTPSGAEADANSGLALGRADDLFVANLLIVRGRALELRHDDRAAIADYSEAQRINEVLLSQAVEKKP
ncbi:MAG: hypothetical protein JST54_33585 [Deltaproteobacteria bacterium]|nr:hypothetical protein [Deltaproteobacteria bacterium]